MSDAGPLKAKPLARHHKEKQDSMGDNPGQEEDWKSTEEAEKSDGDGNVQSEAYPRIQGDSFISQVHTATPKTLLQKEKLTQSKAHPLTLEWAFGIDHTLPVFSLQDLHDQLVILYAGSHVGIIYNHTSNSQHLLQGHCNPISCLCVSEDRRWLVTADKGPGSMVIIWDSYSGIPVRTLFDCHLGGVVSMALSRDAKHVATLGAEEVQRVCIWDWTNELKEPLWVTELCPDHGFQKYIIFNPNDDTELLSSSLSQVLFYKKTKTSLEYIAPELNDKTFRKTVGSLSQSVFHWKGPQALTATSAGNLVLWDMVRGSAPSRTLVREAIKLIPLQKEPITVLTQTDRCIVTGDTAGQIRFYDENIKLLGSYQEFCLDAIASISFSKEFIPKTPPGYQKEGTVEVKPFTGRNLLVSTATSTVVHINTQDGVHQTLLREHCKPLHAVTCHPKQPVVAMGSHSGILKLWDYNSKVTISSRIFDTEKQIQCIAFDPQGFHLAVGFASGAVHVLDACTLQSDAEECFNYSQHCITHITFSSDSHYLATADTGKAVMVFHLQTNNGLQHWSYVGRHHSHYKPIKDLLFGVYLDSTRPRLLSLGMDRRLVEYDLDNSKENNLLILSSEQVEQSAVPTCMTWYPPLTTEHFLLTASDQFKMKLFNSTTKMCRKTLLGPTYGSPVEKIVMLPMSKEHDTSSYYLAYITDNKLGLQIMPIDGNPYKSNALICHPTGVSALACSYDCRFVFTAGGSDSTVFSWEICLNALEAAAALGGKDMLPYYTLLEGGRDGEFYKEMEDYFYYCQLRNQGLDTMESRQVSTQIPLAEVPFVMRALGFYPTEQELEDMKNEVKFSRYAETGRYVTDIDLEEFIKLYINHRPVCISKDEQLVQTFQLLSDGHELEESVLKRDNLLELLQSKGEHLTEDEVTECFTTLLGLRSKKQRPDETNKEQALETVIPEKISMETFTSHILGFPSYSESSAPE